MALLFMFLSRIQCLVSSSRCAGISSHVDFLTHHFQLSTLGNVLKPQTFFEVTFFAIYFWGNVLDLLVEIKRSRNI